MSVFATTLDVLKGEAPIWTMIGYSLAYIFVSGIILNWMLLQNGKRKSKRE